MFFPYLSSGNLQWLLSYIKSNKEEQKLSMEADEAYIRSFDEIRLLLSVITQDALIFVCF